MANRNLLKAHCPVRHPAAADGFVSTGINVSDECIQGLFRYYTIMDIYYQLRSHILFVQFYNNYKCDKTDLKKCCSSPFMTFSHLSICLTYILCHASCHFLMLHQLVITCEAFLRIMLLFKTMWLRLSHICSASSAIFSCHVRAAINNYE